ncbi:hypothetical protein A3K64_01100 [Candidatus Micrarchaeota archaeon RBG_16_36_9]|nr:MAG: hypothetical protein A3K64_01100 [Candidatus Micrarchaeota archaeon RBG_16_36_9]
MNSKVLTDFKHLDKNFFVKVDTETSKRLVKSLKEKYKLWKFVESKINTKLTNIHRMKETGVINFEMFNKIINELSISFDDIRDKIIAIKTGDRGNEIPNVLPLTVSGELSSLLAHVCGDGGLQRRSCRFEYTNSREEIIKEVKRCVREVFRFDEPYERRIQKTNTVITKIIYPSVIGKILKLTGAPRGRKTTMEFEVPEWVMKGSKNIKRSFLQALFDDEGSVEKRFLISLSLNKHYPFEGNLLLFLNQIKELLEGFGIDTISVSLRKNKKEVKGVLRISNLLRMEKFAGEINFNHIKRKEKLEALLKTKRRVYKKGGETKNIILNELERKPFSTIEIAKLIKRSRSNTYRWLIKLEKEREIKRLFPTRHKTEITWALEDYNGAYIPLHDAFNAIQMVLEKERKTANDLSKLFDMNKTHILRYLRKLEVERKVVRVKREKNGFSWTPINFEKA